MAAPATYRASAEDFGEFDKSTLWIKNATGSNKVVTIREITADNLTHLYPFSNSTDGIQAVTKITDHQDGTLLTAAKFNSSNADLPSQVTIRSGARITVAANSIITRSAQAIPQDAVGAGSPMYWMTQNGGSRTLCSGHYVNKPTTSRVQGIVLRAGEGLAMYSQFEAAPFPRSYQIQFNILGGSQTYTAVTKFVPGAALQSQISIMNATGSSVSLVIQRMTTCPMADSGGTFLNQGLGQSEPGWNIARISTKLSDTMPGTAAQVVPMNSANSLPSSITVLTGNELFGAGEFEKGVGTGIMNPMLQLNSQFGGNVDHAALLCPLYLTQAAHPFKRWMGACGTSTTTTTRFHGPKMWKLLSTPVRVLPGEAFGVWHTVDFQAMWQYVQWYIAFRHIGKWIFHMTFTVEDYYPSTTGGIPRSRLAG